MNRSLVDYDMHLAAVEIAPGSVHALADLGFQRDQFVNLTHCQTGEYHGTYRGEMKLPDDELWETVSQILQGDARFSGYLEEERTDPEFREPINSDGEHLPNLLPSVPIAECTANLDKACDIHIGINLTKSTALSIEPLQRLEVSSVDKPTPDGVRRVYTITFESLEDGKRAFLFLRNYLNNVPGLVGKIKMEKIVRRLRKPADAMVLPILTSQAFEEWFSKVEPIHHKL